MGENTAGMTEAQKKPLRPLDAHERRVLGVLIEKGKTTPDQYPLSLNAVVTGSNQKSNRDPAMTLDEESVTRALVSLRQAGAVAEVFGSGKIPRYRHLAYEWFGVGKEELAIMGELLLRGEQSEGDLRGRASRMDLFPDLDALRKHLDTLASRGLVIWLSPPGRGRMLTHGLLPTEKLEKVRSEVAAVAKALVAVDAEPISSDASRADGGVASEPLAARIARLEVEVVELRERLATVERASA